MITSSTAFQDDGIVASKVTRSMLVTTGPQPFDANEIADFLGKPVIIQELSVSTTDGKDFLLTNFSIADALETNSIWTDKLKGYNLIRATAVVKLVVNANPFQAGRLIMTFLPCYKHLNSTEKAARNVNSAQVTTQPNVELNIADSTAEMHIPYVTPLYYYDRKLALYDWGQVFLRVLSPLVTGSAGETSYNYTIFLSFKDVELAAPTYFPESSLSRTGKSSTSRASRTNLTLIKEAKKVSGGVVESTATKILAASKAVKESIFATIPGVGTAASMVGAVSHGVASVASVFGWNKPITQDVPANVLQRPFKYLANADGAMCSDVPTLGTLPFIPPDTTRFGSTVDEMSVGFLKKVPSQFDEFQWATSDVHSTLLYSVVVGAATLGRITTKVTGANVLTYFMSTPMLMLAKYFDSCRGGYEITMKFIKTNFHSGRLLVTFDVPIGTSPAWGDTPYQLREIVDLKTADELTLSLPYMLSQAYISTGVGGSSGTATDRQDNIGTLRIYVLNELRSPETVSSEIQILLYVNPADDFELAYPIGTFALPFSPESALITNKGIGNSEIDLDCGNMMNCSADPFVSVKQMLTASRRIFTSGTSLGASGCSIAPNWSSLVTTATTGPRTDSSGIFGDYFALLSTAYAFNRGGVRIANAGVATASTNICTLINQDENLGGVTTPTALIPANNSSFATYATSRVGAPAMVRISTGGAGDAILPFMSRTPIRLNRFTSFGNPDTWPSSAGTTLPDQPQFRLNFTGTYNISTWTRSGADDFCLGYFIGFMPLLLFTAQTP